MTPAQLAFVNAYADALAEKFGGAPLDLFSLGPIQIALESAGIEIGTPCFEEADAILVARGGLFVAPPEEGEAVGASRARPDPPGWVYVLENASLPGLLKIGMTSGPLERRVKQLSASTSVPTPFVVLYALETHSFRAVECAVHVALASFRVNGKEFFRCDLAAAIAAIELAELECS